MDDIAVETKPARTVRLNAYAAIAIAFSAFFAYWLYGYALVPPIDFNEAYNLQIAESLAKHFCYCTSYLPARVFPVEESTNGIAQYVLALAFHLGGNVDVAVASSAVVAMLAFLVTLYVTGRTAIFVAPALFVWWPMQTLVSVGFVGEIWSLALALAAIAAVARKRMILATLFAGLAIESKLIVAFPLFLYVFGMLYARATTSAEHRSMLHRASASLATTIGLVFGSLAFLCVSIAFSLVHSEPLSFSVPAILPTFFGFLVNMAGQGQAEHAGLSAAAATISNFSSPVVLACVSFAAVALVAESLAFVPLVAVSAVVFLFFGRAEVERHVLVFFDILLVFGALSLPGLVLRLRSMRVGPQSARAIYAATAFCCAVFLTRPPAFIVGQRVPAGDDRERAVFANQGWYFFAPKLLAVLRAQPAIATSGWWQFPEITARYDLPRFYDRTAATNDSQYPAHTALFFDRTNRSWPATTVEANCGDMLYREGPLVVCRPKTGRNIAFVATTPLSSPEPSLSKP